MSTISNRDRIIIRGIKHMLYLSPDQDIVYLDNLPLHASDIAGEYSPCICGVEPIYVVYIDYEGEDYSKELHLYRCPNCGLIVGFLLDFPNTKLLDVFVRPSSLASTITSSTKNKHVLQLDEMSRLEIYYRGNKINVKGRGDVHRLDLKHITCPICGRDAILRLYGFDTNLLVITLCPHCKHHVILLNHEDQPAYAGAI